MISRRIFLKNGAFALVSVGFAPSFLARTAFAQGRSARARQLIAIFQRGASDGLNVIVPFRAVALTAQLPRMLAGAAPALAVNQIGQFGIRAGQASDMVGASFEAEYAAAADRVLNGTGREAFDAIKMLKVADPTKYQPENGADYPRSPFGQALKQIAQLAKAGVGLEVAFADIGGWDTHVNQGSVQGQLAGRLDDLSRGIAALVSDLGDRMSDIVVLTMSEF